MECQNRNCCDHMQSGYILSKIITFIEAIYAVLFSLLENKQHCLLFELKINEVDAINWLIVHLCVFPHAQKSLLHPAARKTSIVLLLLYLLLSTFLWWPFLFRFIFISSRLIKFDVVASPVQQMLS